jgi:chemotaxis protein MotA
MRISLSTSVGVLSGGGVVLWGIASATDNYMMFYSPSSIAIVFGGTITASFIGYRWRYIFKAMSNIFTIFIRQKITPKTLNDDVKSVLEWAKQIQDDGQSAIEPILTKLNPDDEFSSYMFGLMATGYKTDDLQNFGETSIEEHYFRRLNEANILSNMGSAAPAFGMVGTLIGLIVMLGNLSDPGQMGPGLSMALMTTLYGVLVARFIFLPTSTKLKQKLGIQRFREYILLEGILLISQKKNPFYIKDKLNALLDRKSRLQEDD